MRKLRVTLASLLAAAVVLAPAVYFSLDRANETASEAGPLRLQGRWELQAIEDGGPVKQKEPLFVYLDVGETSFMQKARNEMLFQPLSWEYSLDPTKEPKHLDMRFWMRHPSCTEKALYRLENGMFLICRNRKDPTQRPETFRVDIERGIVIETYVRDLSWRRF